MLSAPHVGGSVEKFVEIIACQLLPSYLRNFAPKKLKHHRLQKLKLSSSRASQNENKRSPGSGILLVKNNFTLVDGFLDCLSV